MHDWVQIVSILNVQIWRFLEFYSDLISSVAVTSTTMIEQLRESRELHVKSSCNSFTIPLIHFKCSLLRMTAISLYYMVEQVAILFNQLNCHLIEVTCNNSMEL